MQYELENFLQHLLKLIN